MRARVKSRPRTGKMCVGREEGVGGDAAHVGGHEQGEVVLNDLPVCLGRPSADVAQSRPDLLLFVEFLLVADEQPRLPRALAVAAALAAVVVVLVRRIAVGLVGQALEQLLGFDRDAAPGDADWAVDLHARLLDEVGEDEGDACPVAVVGDQLLDGGHREASLAHPSEHLAVKVHVGDEAPRHIQESEPAFPPAHHVRARRYHFSMRGMFITSSSGPPAEWKTCRMAATCLKKQKVRKKSWKWRGDAMEGVTKMMASTYLSRWQRRLVWA